MFVCMFEVYRMLNDWVDFLKMYFSFESGRNYMGKALHPISGFGLSHI